MKFWYIGLCGQFPNAEAEGVYPLKPIPQLFLTLNMSLLSGHCCKSPWAPSPPPAVPGSWALGNVCSTISLYPQGLCPLTRVWLWRTVRKNAGPTHKYVYCPVIPDTGDSSRSLLQTGQVSSIRLQW